MATHGNIRQELIIAGLASSREEEADACRAAQESLAKQRPALAKSEGRVRELEFEVSNLVSLLDAANTKIEKQSVSWGNEADGRSRENGDGQAGGEGGSIPSTSRDDDVDVCRYDTGDTPKVQERSRHHGMINNRVERESTRESAWRSSRETKERERVRSVVFALEESLHAAREEAENLKRRVTSLRAALREAQQRGHQMEAAASSACAVADAAGAAAAAATIEADTAKTGRHETERNAVAAQRRQREKVEVLQAEVSQATAAGFEAREELAVAQGDVSRLQRRIEDSDRRAAVLDGNLALSTTSLHEAEAGRVRALVGRVRSQGWEEQEGRDDDCSGYGAIDGPSGRVLSDAAVGLPGILPLTPLPMDKEGNRASMAAEAEKSRRFALDDGSNCSPYETATLRDRLVASQAQHMELVRASQEAMAHCNQRCEARVEAVLVAGRLALACSRKRGVVAGRASTVEAASRLALVKRCFRALREEALIRSRDRSIRRQDRIQRWIGEAFEGAGEEITRSRHYQPHFQRRWVGEVVEEAGEGGASPKGSVSSSSAGTTASVLLVGR